MADKERPILPIIGKQHFDFDQEKLLRIAQNAKEVGVELFVLDDGWLGKRINDRTGLGDWVTNRESDFQIHRGFIREKFMI